MAVEDASNKNLHELNWKSQFWSIREAQRILDIGIAAFARDISRLSPSEFRFFLLGAAYDFGTNNFPQEAEELLAIVAVIFKKEDADKVRGYIQEFEDGGSRASARKALGQKIYKEYSTVRFVFL